MSSDPRCPSCGVGIIAGEAKIAVAFTLDEIDKLVFEISDRVVARRLLCAMGLLDKDRAEALLAERIEVEETPTR